MKAPESLSYEKFACILWSYRTVFPMIDNRACLRPGESVLITGPSGVMGTAAIQLAKPHVADPIISLSSKTSKKNTLIAAGANVVLNYKDEDIETHIRRNMADRLGVDVVLDNVGGHMAKLGANIARMGGRIILAGTMGGEKLALDITQIFVETISILGSRDSTRRDQEIILQLTAQGKLDPIISNTFPLTEVAEANRILDTGENTGKIVLLN